LQGEVDGEFSGSTHTEYGTPSQKLPPKPSKAAVANNADNKGGSNGGTGGNNGNAGTGGNKGNGGTGTGTAGSNGGSHSFTGSLLPSQSNPNNSQQFTFATIKSHPFKTQSNPSYSSSILL